MNLIFHTIANTHYEFTLNDDGSLLVRRVGDLAWWDAFTFFRPVLDDGTDVHDELFVVMDKLKANA